MKMHVDEDKKQEDRPIKMLTGYDKNDKYIQRGARLVIGKIYKCIVNNKPSLNKKMFTQMIKCLHDMSAKELGQFLNGETVISQTPQGDITFKFKSKKHYKKA